jgi:hypothetical protein
LRLMLHASRLELRHPRDGRPLCFVAQTPFVSGLSSSLAYPLRYLLPATAASLADVLAGLAGRRAVHPLESRLDGRHRQDEGLAPLARAAPNDLRADHSRRPEARRARPHARWDRLVYVSWYRKLVVWDDRRLSVGVGPDREP